MRKHKIRDICRRGTSCQAKDQIAELTCGNKQENDVSDKIDQCTSQILGRDKEQYMNCRQHRRDHNINKTLRFRQDRCQKKYIDDLHKL